MSRFMFFLFLQDHQAPLTPTQRYVRFRGIYSETAVNTTSYKVHNRLVEVHTYVCEVLPWAG